MSEIQASLEVLETYRQNGGTYVIPVEFMNNFVEEIKELEEQIDEMKEDLELLTSDDDNDSVWLEEENM